MPSNSIFRDQILYTKLFLHEQLKNEIPDEVVKQFRKIWWSNPCKLSSLKLSKKGYLYATTKLNLTTYEFDLSALLPNHMSDLFSFKDILTYTNGLSGPWYLKNNMLILFDSKDATLISLYGPERFRKTLESRNSK
jgi:hypothetical protein